MFIAYKVCLKLLIAGEHNLEDDCHRTGQLFQFILFDHILEVSQRRRQLLNEAERVIDVFLAFGALLRLLGVVGLGKGLDFGVVSVLVVLVVSVVFVRRRRARGRRRPDLIELIDEVLFEGTGPPGESGARPVTQRVCNGPID